MRFSYKHLLGIAMLAMALTPLLSSCGRNSSRSLGELLTLAANEAQVGNWKQAMVYSRTASERNPEDVTALVMLGLCQENGGSGDEALKNFMKAVKVDPANFHAQYNLGRLLYQHGRYEDSLPHLRAAYELNGDDASAALLMAQVEGRLKLLSALKYYKKLTVSQRFKNKPEPWNQMGVIYAERKDVSNAMNCFFKAYSMAPENYVVVLNFGRFLDYYMNTPQSREKAVALYRKYLQLSEINPAEGSLRAEVSRRIKELSRGSF